MTLSREGFDRLLDVLDPDREAAGARYEDLRRRLVRFFTWRGGHAPEELADETLDRVARRVAEGEAIRADDPAVYVHGVARNVLREAWARQRAHPEPGGLDAQALAGTSAPPDEGAERERRLACLESCVGRLPPETRGLVWRYYAEEKRAKIEGRRELAERLGIGIGALRIRMHRIRARLEGCVRGCLARETEAAPGHSGAGEGER